MSNTIKELFDLQRFYLYKILENISDERLYEKQNAGFNSAGWILGHLIVESEDLFKHLKINTEELPQEWFAYFKGGSSSQFSAFANPPSKEELIRIFDARYDKLIDCYMELTKEQREAPHPSKMLGNFYTNLDSWFAHHLVNHLAIHCGNLATWKKMIGLEVQGF